MIFDSTYYSKEHKELIEDIVGKPYSLIQSLKLKGIGSKRLMVDNVSPNMQQYVNKVSDINYANIELRPNGILIHMNKGLKTFSWIIPFYHLVIYKINGSSIHAQGKFIHFKNNINFRENKSFFKKLLHAKVKYEQTYNVLPY